MWLCLRKFPPLGLHKRIMNFPCLLILLIHTKHKNNKMKSWTDATSWFRVPTDLFLLFAHDISTNMYDPLSFILSLCTTIQTKIRVLIDLFLLFRYDHLTKIYYRLSFILSLCMTIQSKIRVLITSFFYLCTTTIRPS